MNEISLPQILIGLPYPWCITSAMKRRDQIALINYGSAEAEIALDVLERCLNIVSQLPKPSITDVPEPLTEYWNFTVEWLADKTPILDEFKLIKVEEQLKEYGIELPSPNMIESLALNWLYWVLSDIADTSIRWLDDALIELKDPTKITRLIEIVSYHWQSIEPTLAKFLLICCASVARKRAIPLLEAVERNPKADPSVREIAKDYQRWVFAMSEEV